MKTILVAALSAFFVAVADADPITGVWTFDGSYTSNLKFQTPAYWENGLIPTNVNDSINFSRPAGYYDGGGTEQCYGCWVENINWSVGSKALAFARMWGPAGRQVNFDNTSPGFGVGDVADFYGRLAFARHYTYNFSATAEKPAVVQRLVAEGGGKLTVPEEGTTLVVSNVLVSGAINKFGSGAMKIVQPAGEGMDIYQSAGPVEVVGAEDTDEAGLLALLAKAAFWTDANVPGSYDLDGENRVEVWYDVRGREASYLRAKPYQQNADTPYAKPWITTDVVNGLSVMDFGDFGASAKVAAANPNCCALGWFRQTGGQISIDKVTDAFVAAGNSPSAVAANDFGAFFSHHQQKFFYRGNAALQRSGNGTVGAGGHDADATDVRDGHWEVDGTPVPTSTVIDDAEIRVVSYRCASRSDGVALSTFAGQYGQRTGGMRFGEALFFTNRLTVAERRLVTRYLKRKWRPGLKGQTYDAGLWWNKTSEPFPVAADTVVSVRDARTDGTAVVKTGEGTLEIGQVVSGKALDVQAGTVRMIPRAEPSAEPAPAAAPYRHFDADDVDSVVWSVRDEDGAKIVTEWKNQGYKTNYESSKSAQRCPELLSKYAGNKLGYPVLNEGGLNGRSTVSMGSCETAASASLANAASMMFVQKSETTGATVREGFVMARKTGAYNANAFIFGPNSSSWLDFYPDAQHVLRNQYAEPALQGTIWYLDGYPLHPIVDSIPNENPTRFHLFRFAAPQKLNVHGFCEDRGLEGNMNYGGYEFAEVILYDRELTEQERVDTEAYLMRKWLGKDSPAAQASKLTRVSVADGAKFTSDKPVSVNELTLAGTSHAFAETANVSVGKLAAANLRELEVGSGTFTAPLPDGLTMPIFHFDATDLAGMRLEVSADGAVTNVLEWANAERNGLVATSLKGRQQGYKRTVEPKERRTVEIVGCDPKLSAVETRPGVVRTMVDFGSRVGGVDIANGSGTAADSAAMSMSAKFTNVREVLGVVRPKSDNTFLFTEEDGEGSTGGTYNFHRGTSRAILRDAYCGWAATKGSDGKYSPSDNALIAIDGETGSYATPLTSKQTYLVDMASRDVDLAINSIANDRNTSLGGIDVGEELAFSSVLSDADRAFWTRHLSYKWFGEGAKPVFTNATKLSRLTLGGGTFNVNPSVFGISVVYPVARISGSGTINATLQDVETIDVAFANGICTGLTVGGALETVGSVTVNVTSDNVNPALGEYAVVSAASLPEDLNLADWTLDLTGAPALRRFAVSLERRGNAIVLKVEKRGSVLIVR